MYTYVYVYICIYIHRERDMHISLSLYIYIYIYVYVLRHAVSSSCCFFLADGLLLLISTNPWAPTAALTGPLRLRITG